MICLVASSSWALIRIAGRCRPDASKFRHRSIPPISGIDTSTSRHTLSLGNSEASNSRSERPIRRSPKFASDVPVHAGSMRRHLPRLLWPAILSATNSTRSAKELRRIISIIDYQHTVHRAQPVNHCTKVQYLCSGKIDKSDSRTNRVLCCRYPRRIRKI
jgi:hypothetical protein